MKRILVIEDNPDNLKLVEMLLAPLALALETARDGPAGLAAARARRFDLILLDIQLPGMDGYAVARALRQIPGAAATPTVAVTSYAMAGDRERALQEGFTEYLEKPLDPATFATTIEDLLAPGKVPER